MLYHFQVIYSGRPIESRIWSIERRHFQWPWTASIPTFKVTPFFDAEYLENGTIYRHSVIEILIGTYTRPTQLCHFEWSEWLSQIFNDEALRGLFATAELLVFLLMRSDKRQNGEHENKDAKGPHRGCYFHHKHYWTQNIFCIVHHFIPRVKRNPFRIQSQLLFTSD